MKKKISIWCEIYKLIWSFSPKHLIFLSTLGLIQALSIIFQLVSIQNFINYVQYNINDISGTILSLSIIGAVLILRRIYNAYFNYNINKHIVWTQDIIMQNFINHTAHTPLNEYYDTDFETRKNRAIQGAESASLFLIVGLMLISFNVPYFIFIGLYYSYLSPSLLLTLILIIMPCFYAIHKNMHYYKELEEKISKNRKVTEYYYRCIGDINYIKETKTLNAGDYFLKKIDNEATEYYTTTHLHTKLVLKNSILGEAVKFVGYICIFLILILLVKYSIISIGLFIAIITSLNDMYSVFNDMVDRDFKSLSSFYSEVVNYVDYINIDYKNKVAEYNTCNTISLNNVTYSYPNTLHTAINNFNFDFEVGKTYAIVGENGAGKTTLSRLILGLLSPQEGSISYPQKTNNSEKMHPTFSALFQSYNKYPLTVAENIFLSDCKKDTDYTVINNILAECGLDINDTLQFPNSINTTLSREFNGIELSGGQWQRIALARCMYRNGEILLLDEPSSAIDPINESTMYKTFKEMSFGKTSIIVSHRLGITSIVDYILVLDKGKLIEYGTHDELIALNGKYKQMYLSQSSGYFN